MTALGRPHDVAAPPTAAELGLMQGAPPPPEKLVTVSTWQEGPHNRWAFQHVSEVVPTALLPRGDGPVLELERDEADLTDLPLGEGEAQTTLGSFLTRSYTDGFLVLRGRTVLYERYFNGMTPATPHLLMSVSKSLAGMLAGEFVESGTIDLAAPVAEYVPELWESAYGNATVAHLLDMTAALEFDENYADQASHVQAQDRAAGWRPRRIDDPGDTYAFLRGLRPAGPHGERFQYCSATTDVLAWVLERATGRRYPELLAECLWARIGAEHDAQITVDGAGFAFANGGVCTTLRDLGRVGLLVLEGGGDDRHRIASDAWVARMRAGGDPAHVVGSDFGAAYPDGSYRSKWWLPGDGRGTVYGVGIYGQFVWIDPTSGVVIVKLSSLPAALDPLVTREHHRAFRALAAALGG